MSNIPKDVQDFLLKMATVVPIEKKPLISPISSEPGYSSYPNIECMNSIYYRLHEIDVPFSKLFLNERKKAPVKTQPKLIPQLERKFDFKVSPDRQRTTEQRLLAVKRDGINLCHIKTYNRTPEICLAAMQSITRLNRHMQMGYWEREKLINQIDRVLKSIPNKVLDNDPACASAYQEAYTIRTLMRAKNYSMPYSLDQIKEENQTPKVLAVYFLYHPEYEIEKSTKKEEICKHLMLVHATASKLLPKETLLDEDFQKTVIMNRLQTGGWRNRELFDGIPKEGRSKQLYTTALYEGLTFHQVPKEFLTEENILFAINRNIKNQRANIEYKNIPEELRTEKVTMAYLNMVEFQKDFDRYNIPRISDIPPQSLTEQVCTKMLYLGAMRLSEIPKEIASTMSIPSSFYDMALAANPSNICDFPPEMRTEATYAFALLGEGNNKDVLKTLFNEQEKVTPFLKQIVQRFHPVAYVKCIQQSIDKDLFLSCVVRNNHTVSDVWWQHIPKEQRTPEFYKIMLDRNPCNLAYFDDDEKTLENCVYAKQAAYSFADNPNQTMNTMWYVQNVDKYIPENLRFQVDCAVAVQQQTAMETLDKKVRNIELENRIPDFSFS